MQTPALEKHMPHECPECGSSEIVEDAGEGTILCTDCGLVIMEKIFDLGAEWRSFEDDSGADLNRAGGLANPLLEGEMGTDIGISLGSSYINKKDSALRRTQRRNAISDFDKTMLQVMQTIDTYCDRMNISGAVLNISKELFKEYSNKLAAEEHGNRSLSIREDTKLEMIAACLFIACRKQGLVRTYNEIAGLTMVPKRAIGAVVKKMEIEIPLARLTVDRAAENLVNRFCAYLNVPEVIVYKSKILAKELQENVLNGRSYSTVAAISIFIICDVADKQYYRSFAQIAESCSVREPTLRKAYRAAYPMLSSLNS